MSKFPSVTGKQVIAALKKAGFDVERKKGSHVLLRHPNGRTTVVPIHAGETIGPGLLTKILRDTELTKSDLKRLLH
ncbi:MAG: type II toxin-antitoxin system HicA family toxin [Dissulfurispiraceae bacterium]